MPISSPSRSRARHLPPRLKVSWVLRGPSRWFNFLSSEKCRIMFNRMFASTVSCQLNCRLLSVINASFFLYYISWFPNSPYKHNQCKHCRLSRSSSDHSMIMRLTCHAALGTMRSFNDHAAIHAMRPSGPCDQPMIMRLYMPCGLRDHAISQ